jgi:hypothetical protein
MLVGATVLAQEEEINVAGLVFLDYQNDLPADLLGSKAIVLVGTPAKANESIREDWQPLVEQAHPEFNKAGIDAVAYYFYEDVIAGPDSRKAFAASWQKREIKYVIVLSKVQVSIKKKPSIRYVVMVTAFNKNSSIMSNGQTAWKAQGKDLGKVLDKVTKAAARLDKKTLLTNATPEYFYDVKMIRGQRVKSYFTDLDFGKLAVPSFQIAEIPASKPGGVINNQVEKQANRANEQAAAYNNELANIMKNGYRFEYAFTDPALTDAELMNSGYMYALYKLHSSGKAVKRLLDYPVSDDDDNYITLKEIKGKQTLRYIPAAAPIYKYYIKHLKTGNVYLGENWDADESWQEALDNCLWNIRREKK